jgi:hypothetical protein
MFWPFSLISRLKAERDEARADLADALDCLAEASETIDQAERALLILAEQIPGLVVITSDDEHAETVH